MVGGSSRPPSPLCASPERCPLLRGSSLMSSWLFLRNGDSGHCSLCHLAHLGLLSSRAQPGVNRNDACLITTLGCVCSAEGVQLGQGSQALLRRSTMRACNYQDCHHSLPPDNVFVTHHPFAVLILFCFKKQNGLGRQKTRGKAINVRHAPST